MASTAPRPPAWAGVAGKRLWKNVLAEYSLSGADLFLLERAVFLADEADQLEQLVRASGPLIKDRDGQPIANVASVQHRLAVLALGRILACLRVVGDQDEQDGGVRPQRRSGFRGAYGLRAVE